MTTKKRQSYFEWLRSRTERGRRQRRGVATQAIATQLGITKMSLWRYMTGKRVWPPELEKRYRELTKRRA